MYIYIYMYISIYICTYIYIQIYIYAYIYIDTDIPTLWTTPRNNLVSIRVTNYAKRLSFKYCI